MKITITREWLERRLAFEDDNLCAAGGTTLKDLQKDAESRTVTPHILTSVPTEIGKVLRYVREQKGWSQKDLADRAKIDTEDLIRLESEATYEPAPRTVIYLADACGFSRSRFQRLAKHRLENGHFSEHPGETAFAANSKGIAEATPDELDAIRALVQVLLEKK